MNINQNTWEEKSTDKKIYLLEEEIRRCRNTLVRCSDDLLEMNNGVERANIISKMNQAMLDIDTASSLLIGLLEKAPVMTFEEIEAGMEYGDLFYTKDFKKMQDEGWFISYDGSGYFHDGKRETRISVFSTTITDDIVKKYPYVCWYNK